MFGTLLVIGASLVAVQGSLSGGEQFALDSLMEARRQVGDGPAQIIAAISADLTGDGQPDVAAVYQYQIGPSRNRSGRQWITVLVATDGSYAEVRPWSMGAKGERLVQAMELQGDTIQLRGAESPDELTPVLDHVGDLVGQQPGKRSRVRLSWLEKDPEYRTCQSYLKVLLSNIT